MELGLIYRGKKRNSDLIFHKIRSCNNPSHFFLSYLVYGVVIFNSSLVEISNLDRVDLIL